VDGLIQDLRYAIRTLTKSPGFTLVAVLTLALGIGANTAIFSAVEAVLLRPLRYPDADRLVFLRGEALSTGNFRAWQRQATSYERFAAVSVGREDFTGGAQPERVTSLIVSEDFAPLLGLRPRLGRGFGADDFRSGGETVAIVTDRFWREKLDAAPDAVGRPLMLDRRPFTLVGVMPADIGPLPYQDADVWLPLMPGARSQGTGVIARLKRTVSLAAARAEADVIAGRIAASSRARRAERPVHVESLKDSVVGQSRLTLLVLAGAVAFVLLIACVNVAELLLARSATRRRELALRSALGASRSRIVRQLFAESLLLAAAGAGLGLLLAQWALRVLLALLPYPIPRIEGAGVDGPVLAFTLLLSLVAAVGFGLAPAVGASKADLSDALKEGSRRATGGRRQRRLRGALVVAEVALASVMLVGAGLLIRTFLILHPSDPGFDARNKLVMRVVMPGQRNAEPAPRLSEVLETLVDRASAVPGMRAVAAVTDLPFTGDSWLPDVWIGGRRVAGRALGTRVLGRAVTPDYMRVMGMPLVAGRAIRSGDDEGAPRVAVINQTMARRFWPGVDPRGRHLGIEQGGVRVDVTVVGVVRDARVSGEAAGAEPELYVPFRQFPSARVSLVAQTGGPPLTAATAVRRALREGVDGLLIRDVTTMDRLLFDSVAYPRFHALLLGILAGLALALAVVGLYGVVAYSTSQRVHEIGIRMALGARTSSILGLVVGEAAQLVLAGTAVGALGALAVTRVLRRLLFGVAPADPVTFGAVVALMVVVALVACYVPARRAMKVDPVVALKSE
jgi:predicted permease